MILENEINQALQIIKNGGNILCPTDTIWGLSADATNEIAVDKVFQIKNRPTNKSMIVLVSSIEMLKNYVEEIPQKALTLIKENQTPTSIIYPKGKNLAKNVLAANGSIAIRIVNDDFCKPLIEKLDRAIISTSANLSSKNTPSNFNEISLAIKTKVDYIINLPEKNISTNTASSIYLIEKDKFIKIR